MTLLFVAAAVAFALGWFCHWRFGASVEAKITKVQQTAEQVKNDVSKL
jgi:hypothetical protein